MRLLTCFCLALLFVPLFQVSSAQDVPHVPCGEIHAIARISRADSLAAFAKAKQNAGSSYRARVVFAARSFELQSDNRSSAVLPLNLLPQDGTQHTVLMTLGDSLCDGESVAEMKSLSRFGARLTRDFAKAVLLAPEMLPKYVAYASASVEDPHSDYAVQMQAVCQTKRSEFLKAVEGLPTDQRDWFVKHVFNPDKCHALALPETE